MAQISVDYTAAENMINILKHNWITGVRNPSNPVINGRDQQRGNNEGVMKWLTDDLPSVFVLCHFNFTFKCTGLPGYCRNAGC